MKNSFAAVKYKLSRTTVLFILVLWGIVCIYPLVWTFINSLKSNGELYNNPWWFTDTPRWKNYADAWIQGNIGSYFFNSVFVTLMSLLIIIISSLMAAFAIKRFKWRMSELVLVLFLSGVMIPLHTTIIPLFMTFGKLNIINTRLSLILAYASFSLPVSIFILTAFISSIPREFDESAVIDGCSMPGVFLHIIIPMSRNAVFTIIIFNFIAIWNELLYALIFISDPKKMTIPVGLTSFAGRYSTDWTLLLAAIIITVIPSIIVYIFLHNNIIKGITAGALKG